MKVKLSTSYGFCYGIKRAIALAEAAPNSVIIGGSLCNNPDEMSRLKRDYNISVQYATAEINSSQTTIIRAHGIAEQIEHDLRARGVKIIDATCPNVKAIQQKVKQLDASGYKIILHGDPDHPEILGYIGYAKNPITVVKNTNQLPSTKFEGKIAVISQTIKNENDLFEIHRRIKGSELFNTICTATKSNQQAAISLARTVDILIAVGGRHSANSNMLVEVAKNTAKHI